MKAVQTWKAFALVVALASSAQAGIGDELNASIKNMTNLQFSPLKGRVMRCTGVYEGSGMFIELMFMDGVEEGRSVCRLDKGALDTKIMNSTAKTYGSWKHIKSEGKVKYFYCAAHGGMWSHYNTVNGYPTYWIYSNKLAQTLNGGQEAPTSFAPDQNL